MALAKARSDYLALICMSVSRNFMCHKDPMLQHGTGIPISLLTTE